MTNLLTTLTGYRGESPDVDQQCIAIGRVLTRASTLTLAQMIITRPVDGFNGFYVS